MPRFILYYEISHPLKNFPQARSQVHVQHLKDIECPKWLEDADKPVLVDMKSMIAYRGEKYVIEFLNEKFPRRRTEILDDIE